MTTFISGATAKFMFEFFVEGSDTVLEDQDSVKFYINDVGENEIIYESDSLVKQSTGTYVIYYTMPFNINGAIRKQYTYKAIGLKDAVQTVKTEPFYVE